MSDGLSIDDRLDRLEAENRDLRSAVSAMVRSFEAVARAVEKDIEQMDRPPDLE